jgi:tetratricopeptide (TPR) repeat protein
VGCANLRGSALVHLGRREEAAETLYGALGRDPENSHTHANQGWTLLHRGDRQGALSHFREALRLDPENDWPRDGLVEAMKAGNPLYAAMLRYFLWMQRLSHPVRWGVILGGIFGFRVLRTAARLNPGLKPYLVPLMVLYGIFVLLSWTAPQLFNSLMLLSRDGRQVLSEEQRESGQWVGGGFVLAALAGIAALVVGEWWTVSAAILATLALIPLASTFRGPRGRPTRAMSIFTGVVYALSALSVGLASRGAAAGDALFSLCLLLVVGSTWVINVRSG